MKPLGLGEHGQVTHGKERGKNYAYVLVRLWSGKTRQVKRSGATKAEASRRVMAAVEELLAQGSSAGLTKAARFSAAYEGWLASFTALVESGKRAESSLALYTGEGERLVLPRLGDLRLGEINTPVVERFIQGVHADKGAATAKVCKTLVSNVCSWAVRQGGMTANPVRELTPIEAQPKRQPRALEGDEIHAWLVALDESDYARRHDLPDLARFMLATGVRIGEALGVTWADVDLSAGVVKFERTVYRVKGKGMVARKVKSAASERPLKLPTWAVSLLKERRSKLRAFDGPVFPNARGGWRDRNLVQRSIREVRGSDFEWLSTHTYRKTVATLLDESGMTARQIADQLGHSRVSMTQDKYLGRGAANVGNLRALEASNPDRDASAGDPEEGQGDQGEETGS
ncbi:phage integrase family protein [Nocardioides albertanoniae]|uniref:Phage integrase family protein n=1 Tax=Nocardioides albertanoniae TaxID=1175486 RepID=A0A543ABY4_9ACTN|nr:site-specific integrase [Nocardioides albertanoniae]TQL70067.1 phage integrase family protein [Nocardioides albertanoniae]